MAEVCCCSKATVKRWKRELAAGNLPSPDSEPDADGQGPGEDGPDEVDDASADSPDPRPPAPAEEHPPAPPQHPTAAKADEAPPRPAGRRPPPPRRPSPPPAKPKASPPTTPPAPRPSSTAETVASILEGEEDPEDEFARVRIPENFDAIGLLKRIANSTRAAHSIRLRAAQIVAAHESAKGKGRIPWESIRPEAIPDEVKHRLAGMLLASVSWAELPEEVRLASAVRRRAWRLLGVLPESDEVAAGALARIDAVVAELRAEVAPAAVEVEAEPLTISVAAEARQTPPSARV